MPSGTIHENDPMGFRHRFTDSETCEGGGAITNSQYLAGLHLEYRRMK